MKTPYSEQDQIKSSHSPNDKAFSKGLSLNPPSYNISAADHPPVSDKGNISGFLRARMENSFNTGFSDINIHTNSKKASDLNAIAFTQGKNVHFAPGAYKPYTHAGQIILKHELGHVVQQKRERIFPTSFIKGMPVNDEPRWESEANRITPHCGKPE